MNDEPQTIYAVRKITVKNSGGFLMSFFARWDSGESKGVGTYPAPFEHSIDLATQPLDIGDPITPGQAVFPRIEIKAGKNISGPMVVYEPDGGEIFYIVTGTTLNADCAFDHFFQ